MADAHGLLFAADAPTASAVESASEKTSKSEKRRSRRLSKPRTNSSSASAKPRLALSNLDSLTRSAANSVADLLSPSVEKRASQNLLNSQSQGEDSKPSPDEKDLRSGSHDSSTDVAVKTGRIQRTGTKLARHLSPNKQAASKSASNLALDQTVQTEEEDYEWLKEKAQKDRQAMRDHGQVNASDEVARAPAPYRRKSLLTPGLATRGSDVLRKPGTVSHRHSKTDLGIQERYYNPNLSPVSPLGRIASLDVPSRNSALDSTRPATPAEEDYGRIGGALRIANGGAYSPSVIHAAAARTKGHAHPAPAVSAAAERWHSESVNYDSPVEDVGFDEPVNFHDLAAYDPYAEDAGNPWADSADVVDEISTAIAHASQPVEDMVPPERAGSPSNASVRMEEGAVPFEEEPPITQAPRRGPVTPRHRPSTGEATLRDSRLEMARILDNMFAASRYSPLQQNAEEDWPSSANSERPSLTWSGSGSGSSSNVSLQQGASPAESASKHRRRTDHSRTAQRSPITPDDVIPEIHPKHYSAAAAPTAYFDHPTLEQPFAVSETQDSPRRATMSPSAATTPVAVFTASSTSSQSQSSHPPESPISAARGAKQPKTAAKKLQKRPPRSRSTPPVPVDRIIVSGHRNDDKTSASPIPAVPEDMRARVAERWVSRPLEDREPTVPFMAEDGELSSDYFSQSQHSQHSRNRSAPQFSPSAPPIPKKSAARQTYNFQDERLAADLELLAVEDHDQWPSWQQQQKVEGLQHQQKPRPRRRMSRSELIDYLQRPPQDHSIPPTPSLPSAYDSEASNIGPHIRAPIASSSVYSQSQYQSRAQSRPRTAASRPRTGGYATTDDEDAPIDWSQARRAWAARRQDAGDTLRMQIERARAEIEANGSLFYHRTSWAPQSSHQAMLQRSRTVAGNRQGQMDKRYSLNMQAALGDEQAVDSPLSQPSAAPSPLKQAATTNLGTSPGNVSWVSKGRHTKNVSSDTHASYFPATVSVGTGCDGDVDTDQEEANRLATAAGRYEGGFEFGYEKGRGVGGSAGTRGVAGQKASRKTGRGNLAEGFGVDLSDVPIFVQSVGGRIRR